MEPNFELCNVISIAVDVRKSTSFHEKVGNIENASKIINEFISKVYQKVEAIDKSYTDNCIYAGDGIIFIKILSPESGQKDYAKAVEIAFAIKEIVKFFVSLHEKYSFKAGIGIDEGKSGKQKIVNIRINKNNVLYAGRPVSYSTKICGGMPLKNNIYVEPKYIGATNNFYNMLSNGEKNKFVKTKKKVVENDAK